MRSKAARWQDVYLMVFRSVQQTAVHKIAGQRVTLSHFPLRGDPEGDHTPGNRFGAWRHPDGGQWHLHGHTHSPVAQRGRQLHVGLDAHGLELVPQQWIIDRMTAGVPGTPQAIPVRARPSGAVTSASACAAVDQEGFLRRNQGRCI